MARVELVDYQVVVDTAQAFTRPSDFLVAEHIGHVLQDETTRDRSVGIVSLEMGYAAHRVNLLPDFLAPASVLTSAILRHEGLVPAEADEASQVTTALTGLQAGGYLGEEQLKSLVRAEERGSADTFAIMFSSMRPYVNEIRGPLSLIMSGLTSGSSNGEAQADTRADVERLIDLTTEGSSVIDRHDTAYVASFLTIALRRASGLTAPLNGTWGDALAAIRNDADGYFRTAITSLRKDVRKSAAEDILTPLPESAAKETNVN